MGMGMPSINNKIERMFDKPPQNQFEFSSGPVSGSWPTLANRDQPRG
jgi:hypothetical protein